MNGPVSQAQIQTLLEWADFWDRAVDIEGKDEISFLLRRVAMKIAGIMGVENAIPERVSEEVDACISTQQEFCSEGGDPPEDSKEVRER